MKVVIDGSLFYYLLSGYLSDHDSLMAHHQLILSQDQTIAHPTALGLRKGILGASQACFPTRILEECDLPIMIDVDRDLDECMRPAVLAEELLDVEVKPLVVITFCMA